MSRWRRLWARFALAIVAVLALVYILAAALNREAPPVAPLVPAGGRYAGVAVRADQLRDKGYATLVARAFGALTPENELKWERVQPHRGRFEFAAADRIVEFAEDHDMRVRGHTLVWHSQNPAWLEQGAFSRDELIAIMRAHIERVVTRYRGRIAEWDVVNEAVADDGSLRDSVWLRGIGPEYIALAFRAARAADPQARLFYNDYGAEGAGRKAEGVLRLLLGLRSAGVPVDGVGLQGHVPAAAVPGLRGTLARYAALGLDVVLSEVDVRVALPASQRSFDEQARQYARLGRACVKQPACRGLVVWGLDDRDSWIPAAFPGEGAATLFTAELAPKPAYEALRRALASGPAQK